MKKGRNFDVAVVGGGTSGVIAAIQSARAGARTLLVEKAGMLGGTITNAGVTAVSCFNAYGRQVIAGIGWEMVCRSFREVGEPLPDFRRHSPDNGCLLCVVNRPVFAAIADEMVLESGAEVLLHAMPGAVKAEGNGWRVTLCTKNGLTEIGARVLVDCTGDANMVTMADLEVERNSAYRVQSTCMATGQVAGAAAALAVKRGADVADVPVADLRALLKEHGAIVPE